MHTQTRWFLGTLLLGLGAAILVLIAGEAAAQGDGWLPPANLSNTEGSSYGPRMAADAQNALHLVWYDWVDSGVHWPYILYANKSAGGEWTSYTYLPANAQGSCPSMVVGTDGVLHIVWEGQSGIYYIRRDPGGTWGSVEDVLTLGELYEPDVAVAPDGVVHVVWRERLGIDSNEIYHSFKSPGGSWSTPILVYAGENAGTPLIAADTNSIAHLLINNTGSEVQALYASKPVSGDWSTPQEMAFAPLLRSVEQLTSDSQGELHLAWSDLAGAENRVLYASKPLNQAWSGPRTVFSGTVYLGYVAVAADGQGLAHVAWTVQSGNKSVWYAFERSDEGWTAPSLASDNLVGSDHAPSVAVDGVGGQYIAWDSGPVFDPPTGDGRGEIWYTSLMGWPPVTNVITSGGGTLASASGETNLTFPPGAVTTDTLVTHTPAGSPPTGSLFAVNIFDLSAERVSDGIPVTNFNPPYTITVDYEAGAAIEDTLGLYWWDGGQWVLEPTSTVDMANNRLTAHPDHMTIFAVMGETKRVYLPLVLR